jgi:nucleoid DNA-binding protein
MTYIELIEVVAERTGYTEESIRAVFKALRITIAEALVGVGDSVTFHQLGKFKVRTQAARKVTSPFLGLSVEGVPKVGIIPEHLVLKFRPSRAVRQKLNP